jgi:lipoprotein-anchoring transpeptidase ErfK/SrfK
MRLCEHSPATGYSWLKIFPWWETRVSGLGRVLRLLLASTLATQGALASAGAVAPAAPASDMIRLSTPVRPEYPRPAASWLEAQVALAREGFSCGSIDGVTGPRTRAALEAYQARQGLTRSGELDDATREHLLLAAPPLGEVTVTSGEVAQLQPLSPTWLGKAGQTALAYETILEMVAERAHADPAFIRRLNPDVDWTQPAAGLRLTVPVVGRRTATTKAARLQIRLEDRLLEVRDEADTVIAQFPVSIAKRVEKRPEGALRITVVVPDPDYTFDPELFSESEEARALGRKLILPPGPNNPVGVAWLGLDLPGYGIHGTPQPEQVGRTESHGCFRLANWDAQTLLGLAWVGLPVAIVP